MLSILLILVYVPVINTSFEAFDCIAGTNGTKILVNDPAISCQSTEHIATQVYATTIIVLFGFGLTPFLVYFLKDL